VSWINTLQSQSIEKISFYTLTTEFANYLKDDPRFDTVQVTGHSLGGGLAMITGAQASIPAVGLSGPNALISGRSFKPQVTEEQMNQYTFNIVPNRDIVPMLDDKADQFQFIRCEAEPYDFVGCHFARRSLCEILYTCVSLRVGGAEHVLQYGRSNSIDTTLTFLLQGTANRPAVCQCATQFGYPEPLTNGEITFEEVCGTST
jgi:lipase ATG15